MTRQRAAERDALVAARTPLLRDALRWVGHPQIRNRGTIGGSLAHADPAAELPAVAAVLGAKFVVTNARVERVVDSDAFFVGYLTTALAPDELLTEIRLPAQPSDAGWAFTEVARRHGDFALAGVAVMIRCDSEGRATEARLAFTGVGGGPVRVPEAEQILTGKRVNETTVEEVGRIVRARLDPESDIHASADYRRHVAGVLAGRALLEAASRIRVSG
jgi:carbon-monoxide dehydrogenase medium subunit